VRLGKRDLATLERAGRLNRTVIALRECLRLTTRRRGCGPLQLTAPRPTAAASKLRIPLTASGPNLASVANVGDLVQNRNGSWSMVGPGFCQDLHRLAPGRVTVGHLACSEHSGGHTLWWCLEPGCHRPDFYWPPIDPLCSVVNGPARQRNSFKSSLPE
jgi:hypothetical protein